MPADVEDRQGEGQVREAAVRLDAGEQEQEHAVGGQDDQPDDEEELEIGRAA